MKGNGGFPFVGFTEEDKERLQIVISDVDDTITKNGKLYPDVLEAMWRVKASGRTIVLVTGGSVGWSDAYLRQWPVDAVIAESGAVMICHGKDEDVVQIINPVINKEEVFSKRRLLLEKTEGLPLSSDQCARVFDIAYDKKKMNEYEIKALKSTLTLYGASWAESSIHINAWFGDYDKQKSLEYFFQGPLDISKEEYMEHSIYCGDSFNDQPLFKYIPTSIGMHTVAERRDEFETLPTYITDGGPGDGWCQMAKALLD